MTSDGVNGTAADGRAGAEPPRPVFIKRDDGRLAPRYIGPAYPHTPAGGVTPTASGASGKWQLPCVTLPTS